MSLLVVCKAAWPQAAEGKQYHTEDHCNLFLLTVLGLLPCWSLDPVWKDRLMMDREKPGVKTEVLRVPVLHLGKYGT